MAIASTYHHIHRSGRTHRHRAPRIMRIRDLARGESHYLPLSTTAWSVVELSSVDTNFILTPWSSSPLRLTSVSEDYHATRRWLSPFSSTSALNLPYTRSLSLGRCFRRSRQTAPFGLPHPRSENFLSPLLSLISTLSATASRFAHSRSVSYTTLPFQNTAVKQNTVLWTTWIGQLTALCFLMWC